MTKIERLDKYSSILELKALWKTQYMIQPDHICKNSYDVTALKILNYNLKNK